jgi:choline dehydrogenase
LEVDAIVVGAGSAGCAVTHQLVSAGKRVLLLEAGGDDRKLTIQMPFMILQALDTFDWGYACDPDPTRGGRTERWHRGKVWGGTSSVNGMIYVRGSHADYDLWASEADESWSSANVMALFREMERCDPKSIKSSPAERGYNGQLRVRMIQHPPRVTRAFVDSAVASGYPFVADYNAETQEGVGFTQLTQHRGRRFSAFDAFIRPHLGAANLELMSGALVKRIDIEDGRAVGVTIERAGVETSLRAPKVVLSAGSINSPKLLMLSGVGDARELSAMGIDVKLDRPAVGRSLMDHPLVRITYDMRIRTYAYGHPLHAAAVFAKFALRGQGLMASPHEAMIFARSAPEFSEPDLQFHLAPIGFDVNARPGSLPLMRTPSIFVSIKKNRPESRGAVRLRSTDVGDAPVIDPNLLAAPSDIRSIVGGIKILRGIMAASPMRDLVAREAPDSAEAQSDSALEDFVRRRATIACHTVGNGRMGNDPDAVVDPDLRVRGVEGLWVADASIMPYNISGNTNAPSMMIGYKLGKALAAAT